MQHGIRTSDEVMLSSWAASRAMRRRAAIVVAVSALAFVALLPQAKLALLPVPAFIPAYETALAFGDTITALLLLGQFRIRRSPGLGLLACGYLFTALMATVHLLTFPGAFAPAGLLGAGAQSTAWMYMFWHGGFPLFVIAYRFSDQQRVVSARTIAAALALLLAGAAGLTMLATLGADLLPAIMIGNHYSPAMIVVVGSVWLSSAIALGMLWRRRRRAVLDVWLMVVMSAWIFDVALSAVFNAGRYDLGFYAGRIYGLLAACYVLFELLIENSHLHGRLIEMHRQEHERSGELSLARDAALAADKAKGQFLATMSHEIRTPMNAILGLTHLALDTDLDERQRDYLMKVQAASKALMRLLNDILDYSKIEADMLALEQEEFDLETVVDNVASLFAARAELGGLSLFAEIDPLLPRHLVGDPLRLSQVLMNLVGNAVKFTRQGEVILRIEGRAREGNDATLKFSVIDTGIGLSPEQQRNLFRPFTQADKAIARQYGGTGLGLAICKRLVELMGGHIGVSSVVGEGSVFSFDARFGVAPTANATAASQPTHGLRTLVIDPQETSTRILRQMLESWQFPVTVTNSAANALAALHRAEAACAPFELVLLDEKAADVGDVGGLAGKLRRHAYPSALHRLSIVIMVSAASTERTLALAGAIPADVVLTKPATPSRLLDAIVRLEHKGRDAASKPVVRRVDLHDATKPIHGARVLLVEDNPVNQQVAGEMLAKSGMQVTIANDGIEAVARLRDAAYDLVLMDVQMPIMDGIQATRLVRRLPHGSDVPIVAMTASAMAQDRQDCQDAGMNAHLAKPFDPAELIATLLAWITPKGYDPIPGVDAPTVSESTDLARLLPSFDVAAALDRLGGNARLYRVMLATYADVHAGDGDLALQYLAAHDYQRLARLGHALAGAAGMLGMREVAALANEIATAPAPDDSGKLLGKVSALRDVQFSTVKQIGALPAAESSAH